jgi:hypothetical protein
MDEDGGYEVVKVFTGPEARQQACSVAAIQNLMRLLQSDESKTRGVRGEFFRSIKSRIGSLAVLLAFGRSPSGKIHTGGG